ncbi:MAG: Gfo/Idh/MocA family oxidoreductase [Kiritimatiellae bacterium]|nr:Gfo/Idh/MocA family oxidoreductase [Kiritimatiellia bacterium]
MEISRRSFMMSAVAAGAMGSFAQPFRARRQVAANEKLCHACIGVGGMGGVDIRNFHSHPGTEIVAICDVDQNHLNAAAQLVPNARKYTDWRTMLEKEGDRIDSVNIAIPDHMHALVATTALEHGKSVYCQKPLCHDVAECRKLAETVKRTGLVSQLGTQYAAGIGDRLAVAWLRQGAIGQVKKVYLCSNRPAAIETYRLLGPRPAKGETPPSTLAWDLWLGTAPAREFSPKIYHPMLWRAWQDFGTGWSGDIGCHIFDAVWKGLNMGAQAPLTVKAEVQESWKKDAARFADTWPQSDHITWTFAGNAASGGKPFTMEWFDGLIFPPEDGQKIAREVGFDHFPDEGMMVFGTEGALVLPHTSGPRLWPVEKFKDYPKPKLEGRNHYHHFLDACLGKEMCESHFVQTGPMAETIILGTVAIRAPDRELAWDAPALAFKGDGADVNRFLRRTYRTGW